MMSSGDALPVRSRKRNHKKKPTTVKTPSSTDDDKTSEGVVKDEINAALKGCKNDEEDTQDVEKSKEITRIPSSKEEREQEPSEDKAENLDDESKKKNNTVVDDVVGSNGDDNHGENSENKVTQDKKIPLSPFVQPQEPLYLEGLSDFSKLIEVLRTSFLPAEKYSSCDSNEAKIKCCLQQNEVRMGFDKYASNGFFKSQRQESRKSESRAKDFRSEGNKFFKAKKFNEALDSYSKAVLTAPFFEDAQESQRSSTRDTPDVSSSNAASSSDAQTEVKNKNTKGTRKSSTREFALSLANRSATLFQLNHFEDSLRDAQTALDYDYPHEQKHTLLLRQALCLKSLGKPVEAAEKLQETLLSVEESSDNSIAQEDHDRASSESEKSSPTSAKETNFRTFIQTTFDKFSGIPFTDPNKPPFETEEHLKPPERTGSKLKNASDWVKLCHDSDRGRFLKTTQAVGVDETVLSEPAFATCLNTQSMESFCQDCCEELGHRLIPCLSCSSVRYCSVECRDRSWQKYHRFECDHLDLLLSIGVLRLSLRIVLMAGIQECLAIDSQLGKNGNSSNSKETVSSSYKSIYNLCDHSNDLSPLVSARQTLAAAFMTFIASEKMMGVIDSNDDNYFRLGGIILKHIHQISVNSILMFHQPIVSGPHDIYGIDIKSQAIGTAIYPTLSLINHSCLPNTENFFKGSRVFVKTRLSLKSQSEITLSYGQLFRKSPRSERLESLENQYYFSCKCPACSDDVLDQSILEDMISSTETHPVLAESFLCTSCSKTSSPSSSSLTNNSSLGPLVVNVKSCTGRCLKCGVTTTDVTTIGGIIEKVESAKKVSNLCKALMSFGRKHESEKHLLKTLQSLQSICYPTNRMLLSTNTELLSLYLSLEKYEESKKVCEEVNQLKRIIYGSDSFEHRQGVLQLLNIKWIQQSKWQENKSSSVRTSSMNKKIVQRLMTESTEAVSSGMQLIKKHKVAGGLVLLDSSLVSFLKELVQLERHLKSAA